ncbi:MAG: hypothetical protein ABEK01_05440 [Candidatus Nanohaloarchaea archaeon]
METELLSDAEEYIEELDVGRTAGFEPQLINSVEEDRFVLDDCLVYDLAGKVEREGRSGMFGDLYSEGWRDILGFLDRAHQQDVEVLTAEDLDERVWENYRNGRISHTENPGESNIEMILRLFDVFTRDFDLESYEPEELDVSGPGYRDRRYVSAAQDQDAALVTVDADFAEFNGQVPYTTPYGALSSI